MIDPTNIVNELNTASNLLTQAGYAIGKTPASVPGAYTGLASAVISFGLAAIGVVAAWLRAKQAWSLGGNAFDAIFKGMNVPRNLQAQVAANTVAAGTGDTPAPYAPPPTPAPAPAPVNPNLTKNV